MPIWLTIIMALPQLIKFIKDIIDLWKSIKQLPKEHQAAATAEFKQVLADCKGESCTIAKKGLLDRFRDRLNEKKASVGM